MGVLTVMMTVMMALTTEKQASRSNSGVGSTPDLLWGTPKTRMSEASSPGGPVGT